jgi:hypothetical protein
MNALTWFDRLEARCGPTLAWGAAVAAVVALLPAALLWHAVSAPPVAGRG